jgi:hypothetical protein
MTNVGISITKTCAFRNSTQEFSNVYYYSSAGGVPSVSEADALIDDITALEKTWHSSLVTFARGRLWTQVGDKSLNNMISQKNLSGTGSMAPTSNLDRERAFLFRLRAGVDSRGNPVYLRKWYHSCGLFATGTSWGQTVMENTTGFSAGDKTTMENKMDVIRSRTVGGSTWSLVAKSGRPPTVGETFKSHNYLEHHQLGDMWRAQ